MSTDLEATLNKLNNILDFYKSNSGVIDVELASDLTELEDMVSENLAEAVDYIHDKIEVLSSWEGIV